MDAVKLLQEQEAFESLIKWDRKDDRTTVIVPRGWYTMPVTNVHTVTLILYFKDQKFVGSFKYRTKNGVNVIEDKIIL
jgi:hypothetical protein